MSFLKLNNRTVLITEDVSYIFKQQKKTHCFPPHPPGAGAQAANANIQARRTICKFKKKNIKN